MAGSQETDDLQDVPDPCGEKRTWAEEHYSRRMWLELLFAEAGRHSLHGMQGNMGLCWAKVVDMGLENMGRVHGTAKAHKGVETDGHPVSDDAALGSSSSVQGRSFGQNVQPCELYS